jgi:hypothetical protein
MFKLSFSAPKKSAQNALYIRMLSINSSSYEVTITLINSEQLGQHFRN